MTATLATLVDWNDTWALIRGLWPKWEPTKQQADLWEDNLRPQTQNRVRRALKATAASARWREPTLSVVLDKYRGLAPSHSKTHELNGPPHTPDVAEAEVADMRADLLNADRAELEEAIGAVDGLGVLAGVVPSDLHARDVGTWPSMAIGLVWAARRAQSRDRVAVA